MWLGSTKDYKDTPFNISWPKDPIKALGIYFSYNMEKAIKANVEDKMERLKKQLHWWKARGLSLKGKVLIVKTYGISAFVFLAQMIHIPSESIK